MLKWLGSEFRILMVSALIWAVTGVGIILLAWNIINYYDNLTTEEATVTMNPPYKLTVFPNKILGDKWTQVTVELFNTAVKTPTSIYVIYPNGVSQTLNASGPQGKQSFIVDNGTFNLMTGTYGVFLVNNTNNEIIASAGFNVTYASLSNFVLTGRILPLVPVLSPIIVFMYNHMAEDMNKRRGRIEKKLEWMESSMKYYFGLMRPSFRIHEDGYHLISTASVILSDVNLSDVKLEPTEEDSINNLFHRMIGFANNYRTFILELGVFYFEDIVAEEFLTNLSRELILAYEKILDTDFTTFMYFANMYVDKYSGSVEDSSNHELVAVRRDYSKYKQKLQQWLQSFSSKNLWTTKGHTMCCNHDLDLFLKNNLAFYLVLKVNVNRIALVSYSSESKVKDTITQVANKHRSKLEAHMNSLNGQFYGSNRKLYYTDPFKI